MNKLTLSLPAALIACVMLIGVSQFAEAAGRGGGGRGGGGHGGGHGGGRGGGFHAGGGRGFHGGPVVKGQALSVRGGVKNLGGPVKGQALSVPGGVANLGPARNRYRSGLGLGLGAGVGSGYGFGYGGGFAPWLYESGHIPVPPYFAIHPPVYYSHPVPRTYGYSPFPYPGSVRTPEIVEATPAVITNPYIEEEKTTSDTKDVANGDDVVSNATPQVIINPFVDMAADSGELQVAKTIEHLTEDAREDNSDVSDRSTTEVTPQEIINPFAEQESET